MRRMPCEIEGCYRIAYKGVYCQEGAADFCSVEGYGKIAMRDGLCTAHRGGYRKPCDIEGWCNIAHLGGFCGTQQVGGHRTCRVEECGKWPKKGWMCKQHFKEAQDAASGNQAEQDIV